MMGTGTSNGPDRARIAAEQAVASKLLEDISLKDAKGVLVNITAGPELSLEKFKQLETVSIVLHLQMKLLL